MTNMTQSNCNGSIEIHGHVSAPDFPEWIMRHAAKLGLRDVRTTLHADRLEVAATGNREMMNALALACGLGPQSALVDQVKLNLEG